MNKVQHLKNLGLPSDSHPIKVQGEGVYVEENKLYKIIFPIDPQTGLPSSNIELLMGDNISPELKKYIMENLLQEFPRTEGAPSDELAFQTMVNHSCFSPVGRERFYKRISDLVENYKPKKEG